jgi:hypothetical protein
VLYGDGGLTSIAIADDCIRLARHAEGIDSTIKDVLRSNVDQELPGNVALLGGMAPMGADDAVDLLERIRQRWEGREDGDRTEEKLALVLGWMAHRAARVHLRPLHAELEPSQPGLYPSEVTLYHDAAVLRHRSGRVENAGAPSSVDSLAQLFREMGPRILIRFHTFIPDYDDGSGWVERMATWRHEKESLLQRLAQAYQAPDADKLRQYVTEPNFYDENDAVIRAAHALQRGEEPPLRAEQADAAATSDQSLYAQALIQGYHYLQEASDYWRGVSSKEALLDRLRS